MERSGAAALVVSVVTLPAEEAARCVRQARDGLDGEIPLWVGGRLASELDVPPGVERIASFEELEQRVALLCSRRARRL